MKKRKGVDNTFSWVLENAICSLGPGTQTEPFCVMEEVAMELHPGPWKYCDFKPTVLHIYQWLEICDYFLLSSKKTVKYWYISSDILKYCLASVSYV